MLHVLRLRRHACALLRLPCRDLLVKGWVQFLSARGVPMSPGITDPLKVRCGLRLGVAQGHMAPALLACLPTANLRASYGVAAPCQVLVDDAMIAGWVRQGLPADPTSVQNAAIVTNTQRWPLLLDPQ